MAAWQCELRGDSPAKPAQTTWAQSPGAGPGSWAGGGRLLQPHGQPLQQGHGSVGLLCWTLLQPWLQQLVWARLGAEGPLAAVLGVQKVTSQLASGLLTGVTPPTVLSRDLTCSFLPGRGLGPMEIGECSITTTAGTPDPVVYGPSQFVPSANKASLSS